MQMKWNRPAVVMTCQCGTVFAQPFGAVTTGICVPCRERNAEQFWAIAENATEQEIAIAASALMQAAFANVKGK